MATAMMGTTMVTTATMGMATAMTTRRIAALKSDAHASGARADGADSAPQPGLGLEAPTLLRLLQLSSAVLPIGAFAYSQGLEGAIERGWIPDEAALVRWLGGVGGHALVGLDLPLLLRLHDAWLAADEPRACELSELLLAQRESRELREQDEQLGSAFVALLTNLGVAGVERYRGSPVVSYAFAYARGAVHFEIPAPAMAHAFSFTWLEQQVGAAARLVPLGHMACQRALSQLLGHVPAWIERARALPSEQIGALTPALAMASAWHETQYSRLFRS
jgi:urease accessory protein